MIILVIMVLRYDLGRVQGRWVMPKTRPHITISISSPMDDTPVPVTERKGFEHGIWRFVWGVSNACPESSV